MAVVIPGKLVYLATPHTASAATRNVLQKLPGAIVENMSHHADRFHTQNYVTGGEVYISTMRNPYDLITTWWVRKHIKAPPSYPTEAFNLFLRNVDTKMSNLYIRNSKIFWHEADVWLKYEVGVEQQLNLLLKKLDLPPVQMSQDNVTPYKTDWQDYYDQEGADIVWQRFGSEMQKYNYNKLLVK